MMPHDPLSAATDKIRELVSRKVAPLSWLEATHTVSEELSTQDANAAMIELLSRRFLCFQDADLAQMLAARLKVEIKWSHTRLTVSEAEWLEGRGG